MKLLRLPLFAWVDRETHKNRHQHEQTQAQARVEDVGYERPPQYLLSDASQVMKRNRKPDGTMRQRERPSTAHNWRKQSLGFLFL